MFYACARVLRARKRLQRYSKMHKFQCFSSYFFKNIFFDIIFVGAEALSGGCVSGEKIVKY